MKTKRWEVLNKPVIAALLPAMVAAALLMMFYNTAVSSDENKLPPQQVTTNLPSVSNDSDTNEVVVTKIPPNISALGLKPDLEEIIKMAQSGIGEEVLKQYVIQSKYSYKDLTPQDIITLNDLGVPSSVVAEMLKKAGKSELEKQVEEQRMTISSTNEVITTTAEKTPADTGQTTQQPVQQQVPTATQVYTQTVYVPVQSEQQPQVVVQQNIPETVAPYYSVLSPYGSWLYVNNLGYCWQPTVAVIDVGWRPYCNGGNWMWTDYGWYWHSYYSWGWAPFHYGRWHYLNHHGWIWHPDRVWGPGWVSWRVSPSYCGWAPLPPSAYYGVGVGFMYHGRHVDVGFEFGLSDWHYTFIDWHHFHHRNPYHYYLPPNRGREIYNNSTVINNYISGNNNNVVINTGVGTEHITRVTREEVKKVVVRDAPLQGNGLIPSERLMKDGNNIVLYRPDPKIPLTAKGSPQTTKPVNLTRQSEIPTKSIQPVSPTKPISPATTPVVGKDNTKQLGIKTATPINPIAPTTPTASSRINSDKASSIPVKQITPTVAQPKNTIPASSRSLAPSTPSMPSAPKTISPSGGTTISPSPTAPKSAPSKPLGSNVQQPTSSRSEVTKVAPANINYQPIVTHKWSETAPSTKIYGNTKAPITGSTYSSSVVNQPRPNPILTPQVQSNPRSDIRYRSPSAPSTQIMPQNTTRQSTVRLYDTGKRSVPTATIQPKTLPVVKPNFSSPPTVSSSGGVKIAPLPTPARTVAPQRSATSYTPSTPVAPRTMPTPSYTPAPASRPTYSAPAPSSPRNSAPTPSYRGKR